MLMINLHHRRTAPYTTYMRRVRHSGQVLLITVLVLSIAVTIALALIGRGVSDVSISRNIEESARAFSAAEAGIEDALRTGVGRTFTLTGSNATVESSVSVIGASTGAFTLPPIAQGDVQSVWLVGHQTGSNALDTSTYYQGSAINVCWSHATTPAAVEIILYYLNGTDYMIQRGAYDPLFATRTTSRGFVGVTADDGQCGSVTDVYRQRVTIPAGSIPLLLRIRPYYAGTTATVSPIAGGFELPAQGVEITSVGSVEGGVTRKISVKRQYPWPSSLFDYAIYSQNTFIH